MGILNIEFKQKVEGLDSVTCIGIYPDELFDGYLIIRFSKNEFWEVPLKNIKHISASCK